MVKLVMLSVFGAVALSILGVFVFYPIVQMWTHWKYDRRGRR
jgi:uncharacterized protein (DUF2062 family)